MAQRRTISSNFSFLAFLASGFPLMTSGEYTILDAQQELAHRWPMCSASGEPLDTEEQYPRRTLRPPWALVWALAWALVWALAWVPAWALVSALVWALAWEVGEA